MTHTTQGQNPTTCGAGLAANAVLPGKLADLLGAQAAVLERHIGGIDQTDATASTEVQAYQSLVRGFRDAATELRGLADEMASYRELPMPRHDPRVLAAPGGQMDAFRQFVAVERELSGLLQAKIEGEERLLG